MLAVAVTDPSGRLLGAVTVDDVLDRQLGSRLARARAGGPIEDGVTWSSDAKT